MDFLHCLRVKFQLTTPENCEIHFAKMVEFSFYIGKSKTFELIDPQFWRLAPKIGLIQLAE